MRLRAKPASGAMPAEFFLTIADQISAHPLLIGPLRAVPKFTMASANAQEDKALCDHVLPLSGQPTVCSDEFVGYLAAMDSSRCGPRRDERIEETTGCHVQPSSEDWFSKSELLEDDRLCVCLVC